MAVTKSRIACWFLNLASLAVFAGLLLWSLTDREMMFTLFSKLSYYLVFLLVIVWVIQTVMLLKTLNFSMVGLLKNYWPGFLAALVLTTLVFISVKVGFKTLSDETNLLSVSRSMAANKTVYNTTMAKFYYDNLNPITNGMENRPFVFPFLVHLLHVFTGFRYQNVFVLNFIVMFLFLSGVYIAVRKFLDPLSGIAAMFLVLSCPVFTTFGTSGGYGLLNCAVFFLVMAAAYHFIKSPSSCSFAFLFATLLVFANIRYESIVLLLILPLLVIRKIKWQFLKDGSWLIFLTPLLCLSFIWQRIPKQAAFETPEGGAAFSFRALSLNIESFFKSLVDFNYQAPHAGVLSIASIVIFIFLFVEIARRKIRLSEHGRRFLMVLFVSVLVLNCVYLFYFFGSFTHPSTARFYMILFILFAFGPVALRIFKPHLISGAALLLLSVVCFVFYHPIAVEGRFINTLILNRKTEQCIDFLSKLDNKNILIITSRPGQYVALGYGVIDFAYANQNKDTILLEQQRHLYPRLIVFQEIEYKTGLPIDYDFLHSDYKLRALYEIQNTATEFLRISEVISSPPLRK
jgi:hypothetical protein